MKKIFLRAFIAVMFLCAFCNFSLSRETAEKGNARKFAFKFEKSQPLRYAFKIGMGMDMDINDGQQKIQTKMAFELRYHVKLTPTEPSQQNGYTVLLEASDIEGDWDITGPAGHILISYRNGEVTATQNGVQTIDTKNNIGLAQAREIKQELSALYLTGHMDIDSTGKATNIQGDMPFVEFWTEANETEVGFFGIAFPDDPIPVAGTWKESLTLKKMGDILLDDPGFSISVTFTREPDTTIDTRTINVFTLDAPFTQKNVNGYMDQGGQRVRMNIPSFTRTASGKIRFDAEKGMIIDSTVKADAKASMSIVAEGQSVTMDMTMDMSIDMKLLQ